ncbi:hypothetical protein GUY61_20860 [Streptomyces sp. GC420]|nr:hypothetical protein [Streptomyces sp. GC420]
MRPAGRVPRRGRAAAALLLVLGCAAALLALPGGDEDTGGCRALRITAWTADEGTTTAFARYGDDPSRTDDWTGGDGTHSVRLPDGRTLWLFSDTFLGRVDAPPNPAGQNHSWRDPGAPWTRNSAVVMSAGGELRETLPAPLFPDPAPQQWRWPVAATVEPRSPGSSDEVVRVLLWVRATGQAPWIYGVPVATEVATLSLPGLRLEGITRISDQTAVADPARRVLFGTTAVRDGEWTYVFGGNDGKGALPGGGASDALLARAPAGRLDEPETWDFWDGAGWSPEAGAARPVLAAAGRRGVGSAFTVVRQDGGWLLVTAATGTDGLSRVTSYWACGPQGPWHGPGRETEPPLPRDSSPQRGAALYNPQAHPDVATRDGRLLLSYDVNWLDASAANTTANVSRNVALYRPRFLLLELGPPG